MLQENERRLQEELESLENLEKLSIENSVNDKKANYKARKRRIRVAFTKVSLMAMLLILSTYAWFTTQKDISISNLRGTVEVAENMEISLDAKTWSQEIDLKEASSKFATAQTTRQNAFKISPTDTTTDDYITRAGAILPKELLPVSTAAEKDITGSWVDGATTNTYSIMPFYEGKATGTSLSEIAMCKEYNEDDEVMEDNGYFAFDIYIRNTSQDGADDKLQLNINSAVQVLANNITNPMPGQTNEIINKVVNGTNREYKGNEDSGLQNTVRVALALYGEKQADGTLNGLASATATQKEILTATKDATITDIAIWEPNAYDHVEYIVNNNNKLTDGSGAKTDEQLKFDHGEAVETYGLKSTAIGTTIENVYDIATTGLDNPSTFKTDNNKDASTGKVTSYRIKTTNNKPINITSIDSTEAATDYFMLTSNTVSRLRVYIWLEGQDVDCINQASYGGGIEVDLGLTKDDFVGESGEGIENNTPVAGATLASARNTDIGDYIDLGGTSYVGTSSTADDWRIFYVDEDNDKVYAILADYLPAIYVPTITGLSKDKDTYTYSVWSDGDAYALAEALDGTTDGDAWNFLANGYSTEVTGSPTGELLNLSYKAKENLTNYDYKNNLTLNGDLYAPHTEEIDNGSNTCLGYWLASTDDDSFLWIVYYGCCLDPSYCGDKYYGCRPVVSLSSGILATEEDDVWTLSK